MADTGLDGLDPQQLIDLLFAGGEHSAYPYPVYHRLRELAPIYQSANGTWVLTSHELVSAALREPNLGRDFDAYLDAGPGLREAWPTSAILHSQASWMLNLHPPDHTRVRRLFAKALVPSRVEQLREHVAAVVDRLLDDVQGAGSFDAIADFAFQLPITVIAELLGVPVEDRDQFLRWTQHISASVEPVRPPEVLARADDAAVAYGQYFSALIAERRRQPREDLLSALIAVRDDDGDALTEDELVANSILLFSAGFDTTMNLIGNGLLALIGNPDQYALLRANPDAIPNAIEEILRYDGSAQLADRTALVDLTLAGHHVSPGETVITLLGAGNRDPARYDAPDELDVTRSGVKPLTFGGGIHFCIGAALARMEAHVAFAEFTSRFRVATLLDTAPLYRRTLTNHGLQRLMVAVR